MLEKIIERFFYARTLVFILFGTAMVLGIYMIPLIPIDAVPDVTSVQVVVNTKTGALDPEQVEKSVSYPVESEMRGIRGVAEVRSLSKYDLSQVVIVFDDGTDIYWARQQVSERLQQVRDAIPAGLSPQLAPISTGLGEVLMYSVTAQPGSPLARKPEQERLTYLRSVQDFVVSRGLKANVRNIAEVDSTGGFKKEIRIGVDPERLEAHGLTIQEIAAKLESTGESFGGGYVESQGKRIIIRTQGLIENLDPIRKTPIKLDISGKPIPLEAVARVTSSHAQRLGAATYQGQETVLGIILMLSGANSRQVALDAKAYLESMSLPKDVEIKIHYTRQFLVDATIRTVAKNLLEGAALVVVVLLLVLGNLRAAVLVSIAIPISMLFAAAGMKYLGISANLMSLGAIDFGLLVDGSIVIVENVLRRLEEHETELGVGERVSLILESVQEVAAPVLTGLLIIMAVYVPILALEGVEGKVFRPMALTVLMALGASLLTALFLMPVLVEIVLRKTHGRGKANYLFDPLRAVYRYVLAGSLRYGVGLLVVAVALGAVSAVLYPKLGANFMPGLDEGDLMVNFTRENDVSLARSVELQKQSDRVIARFGEVQEVYSRMGTPESATDPMGVHLSDTFVILRKDHGQWPVDPKLGRRRTKEEVYLAMKLAVEAGVAKQDVSENQPIEMRLNEILEGSRADVSLRIFGKDLDQLIQLANDAQTLVARIPGTDSVEQDALTALRKGPVVDVRIDHDRIARYGIELSQVNRLVETAMAGTQVGTFFENQWRFPIVLRMDERYRDNVDNLAAIPVGLPAGGSVPLGSLAEITRRDQVTTIAHFEGERYAALAINLDGRDTESYVQEAKATLAGKLNLPDGYTLSWGGQFKNLERARERLSVLIPVVLAVIFLALLRTFRNFRQTLLVYLSIPFAAAGGIIALYFRGIPLSVAASIGFIALAGIAILNAMVLVVRINQLRDLGMPVRDAVVAGAEGRFRPILMTAMVASLGFVPMALNTGIGSEVQRPLATVVIGGLVTCTLLTLLILPALYLWIEDGVLWLQRRTAAVKAAQAPAGQSAD